MSRPRITDADNKPPRLIDSADIAADVEKFLAAGGLIDRPAFRRDQCETTIDNRYRTVRRWQIAATPPEVKQFQRRGGNRK